MSDLSDKSYIRSLWEVFSRSSEKLAVTNEDPRNFLWTFQTKSLSYLLTSKYFLS